MRSSVLKTCLVLLSACQLFLCKWAFAQTVYTINPDHVLHRIDEKVYGHFLEHIYNSVNGGLWGELVWNRSFERYGGGSGIWKTVDDEVIQSSSAENVRLLFGETSWQNYEYTLQARKDDGAEGFLIIFRANGESFYWCNLGGWNNTRHAIEKGTPGVRWSVFGSQINGSIQTGRWYYIRIRCEGNHFQVWLDDDKLFDFTDDAAHMSGQVGVGTWVTQARYRNFLVKDLATGDTLYNGVPDMMAEEATPSNWQKAGNVTTYISDDALNSHYALKLHIMESGAGIQQNLINLKMQPYTGSFWAKSDASGNMHISLLKGNDILAQAQFDPPASEWQEYHFQLTPNSETVNGSLRITFDDTGTVCLDQVSMTGQDAIDNGGFRPDLYGAIEALKPPVIRWPGGYFAEYYRWKSGIGPQHERMVYPLEAWNDRDVNSFGTDEFMALCDKLGAEPIVVINIGHRESTLPQAEMIEEAQNWVEYCNGPVSSTWGAKRAANGHPEPYHVRYWEISNEIWLTRNIYTYNNFLKVFIPAMKAIDPDIKIIACGSGSYDQNWNRTLLNNCADIIDYVSTHHYEDIQNYVSGVKNYHDFLVELGGLIASSSNPDIKVYMSEWNFWNGLDWRNGLYTGGMLNTFERNGSFFEIGGPALFLRHSSANDWNNALINFNNYKWFPATNYAVMKFWHDHYAPNFIETTGSHPALNVVSTCTDDGSTLYFKCVSISAGDNAVQLDIDPCFTPLGTWVEQIAPSSLTAQNTMSNPDYIQIETGDAEIDGQKVNVNIPGNSTVIVTVSQTSTSASGASQTGGIRDCRLYNNVPNPFNPDTEIQYELPETVLVHLRIVDVMGRTVTVLVNQKQESGWHQVTWNGKDRRGADVGSGLYFYELITPSRKRIRKMLLIR
ncbi:DUF1080 domain-containing protein [bacterium]|nr:DUF1080 domain-containing protein [bacterium]